MSTIDKHNYEAWLLDAAEGRLSATAMAELQAFLQAHPELATTAPDELPVLEPETIVFEHALIKDETVCIEYVEGLLHPAQMKAVENDATLSATLALYKATQLTADTTVVFPDKASLLKQPKVIPFFQPRILRAAAAVLVIGCLVWLLPDKKESTSNTRQLANRITPVAPSVTTETVAATAVQSVASLATEKRSYKKTNEAVVYKNAPVVLAATATTVEQKSNEAPTVVPANTPVLAANTTTSAIETPTESTPNNTTTVLANNTPPATTNSKIRYTSLDQIAIDATDEDEAAPTNWNQYMTKSEKTRKKNLYGRLLTVADNAVAAGKKLLHFDERNKGYAFAVRDFKVEKH